MVLGCFGTKESRSILLTDNYLDGCPDVSPVDIDFSQTRNLLGRNHSWLLLVFTLEGWYESLTERARRIFRNNG
jgi:hypothetical protein